MDTRANETKHQSHLPSPTHPREIREIRCLVRVISVPAQKSHPHPRCCRPSLLLVFSHHPLLSHHPSASARIKLKKRNTAAARAREREKEGSLWKHLETARAERASKQPFPAAAGGCCGGESKHCSDLRLLIPKGVDQELGILS